MMALLADLKQLYLSDRKVILFLLLIAFIAYGPEFGSFTYSTDYYHLYQVQSGAFTSDGRWFANLLYALAFDFNQTPFLNLLLFIILRIAAALLLISAWGNFSSAARIIGAGIIVIHPYFLENISYSFLAHLGFAILFAVLAMRLSLQATVRSTLLASLLVMLSYASYQTGVNFALVGFCFYLIFRLLDGEDVKTLAKNALLPFSAAIVLGTLFYSISLYFENLFHSLYRLGQFGTISLDHILDRFLLLLRRSYDYLLLEQEFFPLPPKMVLMGFLLYGLLAAMIDMLRQHRIQMYPLVLLLFGVTFIAAAATTIPISGFNFSSNYRVIYPLSVISTGAFLLAARYLNGHPGKLLAGGLFVIYMLVVQNQKAHYLLEIKNQVEWRIAGAIVDRLEQHQDFAPGLPLAIVGTLRNYIPPNFHIERPSRIVFGPLELFSHPYSTTRIFTPLLDFRHPTPDEMKIANGYARQHRSWPATDSVTIQQGIAIVVLGTQKL